MTIQIDIDDLIQEFNLPANTADFIVESTVEEVTVELYRQWRLEASNELKSTRNEYINGLDIIRNSQFSRTIVLNGKLANMIEKGATAFDMKAGFQKSSKVKWSTKTLPNGEVVMTWYLTVPFRIGTPGIVGEDSAFSGIMPEEIHNLVRNRKPGRGLPSGELPAGYEVPSSRAAINIPEANISYPEYTHRTAQFAGLTRSVAANGTTSYATFRRVSQNSDPNSWIHKGLQARNLMQKAIAATDVSIIAENKVDEILNKLGYGK